MLRPMSENVPAIIRWDQAYTRNGDGKLPRAVVHAIRTYMNNHTLTGWVRQETLARDTGLTLRQVQRHIAANVAAGWLTVTDPGNSSGKANDYRLTYPEDDGSVALSGRTTNMSGQARRICRTEDDVYVAPTSPSTSPRNFSRSSEERTSPPEKGDEYVALAADLPNRRSDPRDPFASPMQNVGSAQGAPSDPFGSGVSVFPVNDAIATGQSNDDIYVVLPDNSPDPEGWGDWNAKPREEHFTPWPADKPLPTLRDPFTTYVDDQTGERLWPPVA